MVHPFQTPIATDLSLSQAFALKTTRPSEGNGGPLSPVPQKPPVRRVYARKKSLAGSASSRNLKENAFYTKSGLGPEDPKVNLQTKLRARRTTSFASLKDRRKENEASPGHRLARKSSRASSRRSLASPFSSQPSSPNQATSAPNSRVARSNSKRDRSSVPDGHDLAFPEPKRRNSTRSGKSALTASIAFGNPRNPPPENADNPPPTGGAAQLDLNRRPSHPNLGSDSRFPRDELEFMHAGLPITDFNRPPSQLSVYAPMETTHGNALNRTDSMSSTDRFAAELCAASTPYNAGRISKLASIAQDLRAPSASHFLEPPPALERRATLDDLTENMSLTSVMEPSVANNDMMADHSPWITDSLISPPTIYRRQMLSLQSDDLPGSPKQLAGATNILELDTLTSDSDHTQAPFEDALPRNNLDRNTLGGQGVEETSANGYNDDKRTRVVPGRARSGTIVAPQPIASGLGLGRTRTGTVTAGTIPTLRKQNRQRSGTITPNSVPGSSLAPALPVTGRILNGATDTLLSNAFVKSSLLETAIGEGRPKDGHVDAEVLVDANYDPTPVEEMEFSSAPNPDVDLEFDDDVADVTFCSSHTPNVKSHSALAAPTGGTQKPKLPLLSPSTDANAKATFEDKEVGPEKTGRSRLGNRKVDNTSIDKRSKRMTLKAALGLNPKPLAGHVKDTISGPKAALNVLRQNHRSTTPVATPNQENAAASSDPLDLLSHFDEADFNKPYEAPVLLKTSGRGRGKAAKTSRR